MLSGILVAAAPERDGGIRVFPASGLRNQRLHRSRIAGRARIARLRVTFRRGHCRHRSELRRRLTFWSFGGALCPVNGSETCAVQRSIAVGEICTSRGSFVQEYNAPVRLLSPFATSSPVCGPKSLAYPMKVRLSSFHLGSIL
jgi:hypothetical protein